MRYRLRTLLILSALLPLVIWMLVSVPFGIWDGGFVLNVGFKNNTVRIIEHIEAAVTATRAEADYYVSFPDAFDKSNWKPMVLSSDGIAQINVRSSGRFSWAGRELIYWRERAIVARVEYADGSKSLFATDIPPQRTVRNLMIDIPASK